MTETEETLRMMHIIGRCEEDCDCLIWKGATNGSGHPKMAGYTVRRMVWQASHGEIDPRRLVSVTCGNSKCVNPEHLALSSKAEVSRRSLGRRDVRIRRAAACARANQARFGKLTMAKAQEIRCSTELGTVLAAELGVSPSLISKVRTNRAWVASNPFAGLM